MSIKVKNAAAVELGRLGGLKKSAAKSEAARNNAAIRWEKHRAKLLVSSDLMPSK